MCKYCENKKVMYNGELANFCPMCGKKLEHEAVVGCKFAVGDKVFVALYESADSFVMSPRKAVVTFISVVNRGSEKNYYYDLLAVGGSKIVRPESQVFTTEKECNKYIMENDF